MILNNGLKLITETQPGNPMVSVRLIIKSGSGAELRRADFGLAHLIEHLAFKSTARRDEGENAWEIESVGGSLGAYTWLDETVYHLTLPAEALELGFDVLADMVFAPAYDEDEFAREKEVVLEELYKYADIPGELLADNLYALMFGEHHYGHPVLGFADTVKGATIEGVRNFWAENYRPDNAALIVTGGFDENGATTLAEKYFGGLGSNAGPGEAAGDKAALMNTGPLVKVAESGKSALALVEIAFRALPAADSQVPAAELLAAILSQTQTSRLDEEVKAKQRLVTGVSSYLAIFKDSGLFSICLETEPEQAFAAAEAVMAELKKIFTAPPTDDELARVKALGASAFLAQQDSSDGLGRILGEFENIYGDHRLRDARLAQWDRVSSGDIVKVAARLFRPERMVISAIVPQDAIDAALLEKKFAGLCSSLNINSASHHAPQSGPRFVELETFSGGPKLLVMKDAALPQVIVKAGVVGGLLAEQKGEEGLSGLMAELWPMATADKPRADFLRAAERLGADFSALSGRNSLFLSGRVPAKNFDAALPLLAEIMARPAFAEADLDEARCDRLADLKQQMEDPAARSEIICRENLYGPGHPFSRTGLGRKEALETFARADLVKFHQRLIKPSALVMVIAGDVEPQSARDGICRYFNFPAAEGETRQVEPAPAVCAPARAGLAFEFMERDQAHLRLSFPAAGLGHKDQAALELMAEYLGGGMAGPLFLELRDKKSLAYDVYAHYQPGLGAGEISFYIAAEPSKSKVAVDGLVEIIDDFKRTGVDGEILEGAGRQTVGRRKRGEESLADRAEALILWSLYGLGADFEAKHQKRIMGLAADEIRACADKYLNWEKAVLAVVGPKQAAAMELVRK